MPCTACGTENRAASRFCDNCGAPLEASCPACGAPNRSDARFCAGCGATLGAVTPQAAAAATAERRLVSVLFTDLVGFTTIAEDRDPEAVRELLSRYFATATEAVTLHGGTVEKFIGDAVMAVWGTPIAHEDDAERAVRTALVLIDAVAALHPGLQARGGVLTGEVAVTLGATNQGMVAGDLVNTAARLQGVAEAGTVLVGETTRRAAERSIVFEPLGDQSLKGKTSPVPAWRALRVVAQRGGQGRADGLEPPFVRRQQARAALAAIDGRTDAAVADFSAVQAQLAALEQAYLAALMAVDAVALLPDAAPLRELAERSRPLLEDLRASADIAELDRALASGVPPATARSAAEIHSTAG